MKFSANPRNLKYLTLGCGVLGLVLRLVLYGTGMEQGLLAQPHWAATALWLLTAGTLAALLYGTRAIRGPESVSDSFPAAPIAAGGCTLAAIGTAVTVLSESPAANPLCTVFGILAAAVLVVLGICRLFGIPAHALLYGFLSAYFAMRMVFQYRTWSADPQLMDYCFQLFSCVGVMLASFHLGAFDAGLGSHQKLWFWSLSAVYLCCLTPAGPGNSTLYVTCALWLVTNLTCLDAKKRRRKPKLNLED